MSARICFILLFIRVFSPQAFAFCTVIDTTEVIVISNRQYHHLDGKLTFENKVDTTGKLGYYLAKQISEGELNTDLVDSSFFLSQLTNRNTNWVLFVHGDSKTFEEAAIRGLIIQKTHNVSVIVFSWPTKEEGINGSKNFKKSKRHAEKTVKHLASLIHIFKLSRENHPAYWTHHTLSLFAHSLGNYLLELMVSENLLPDSQPIIFDNLILNAAAVNQKHHKKWLEKIKMQHHVFVISNRHDFNLKGVRIFTSGGKQLGEIVKKPYAENAIYVDFSKSVGFRIPTGTSHTFFIGSITEKSENIRSFYTLILNGGTPELSDLERFTLKRNKSAYNIIF